MSKNIHHGSWQDSSNAALDAAVCEVNLSPGDFITLEYSDGFKLSPIDETKREISVEIIFSESRQQYKAVLRR